MSQLPLPSRRQGIFDGAARDFRWCGKGFSMVRRFFFSLSIIDLQKEEIKRNQKKSVSGYAEIICSNFANENDEPWAMSNEQ